MTITTTQIEELPPRPKTHVVNWKAAVCVHCGDPFLSKKALNRHKFMAHRGLRTKPVKGESNGK
jgi:hypothetical protein